MTKYILPDKIPENAQILDHEITFNTDIILNENDTIEIKENITLKILSNVKFTVKRIINHGLLENAGDIAAKSIYNYGKINNVDLLITDKGKFVNKGLFENYYLLYLYRARTIINSGIINNYEYMGGKIFYENYKYNGNKINFLK
jgi:hypothetical protein